MKKTGLQGKMLLFIAALIWGAAFVAQKIGSVQLGVFTFTSVRFLISGVALLPVALLNGRTRKSAIENVSTPPANVKAQRRFLVLGGVLCGLCLMLAALAQQLGLTYTSAGKAGFITALYILFVPIFRFIGGKRTTIAVWISVFIALIGLYLLCVKEGFSVNQGDIEVLLCALIFTAHILLIDRFSAYTDGVKMSCIQFFVASATAAIPMMIFEKPDLAAIWSCWAPLLYLGVISGGIGYTLQILGQKNTDPTVASLILSLESVFAVVSGAIFLQEKLTAREMIGCLLMFAAIVASQAKFKTLISRIRKSKTQLPE